MKKNIRNFNYYLFKDAYEMCVSILNKCDIDSDEKQFRIEDLTAIWNDMLEKDYINKKIYEKIHEIKSLEFLSKYDNCTISFDSKHETGPDFKINDKDWIECVTSSKGEDNAYLFDEFEGSGVFDYNKKENIIMCRLMGSIKNKMDVYYKYNNLGIIDDKDKYVIFLSAGNLYYGSFFGKFGFALNKILFGVGHETLLIDPVNNRIIRHGFSYNDNIYNHNNQPINCNIFKSDDYKRLSGILFTFASLDEHYNKDNTFFFNNSNAKNKIKLKTFSNIVYWNICKQEDAYVYIPRYRGKNLNHLLYRRMF